MFDITDLEPPADPKFDLFPQGLNVEITIPGEDPVEWDGFLVSPGYDDDTRTARVTRVFHCGRSATYEITTKYGPAEVYGPLSWIDKIIDPTEA